MKTLPNLLHSLPRNIRFGISVIPATLLLGSCGGDSPTRTTSHGPVPAAFVESGQTSSAVAGDGWLNNFRDPVLTSLVREAWTRNPDLYSTAAVYEEALASARLAASTLYPQFNGTGAGRYTDADGSGTKDYSAGLDVSWEVDLWGRLKSDRAYAGKIAQSAGLDYLQARHSLAAAVAESYFAVIAAGEQLSIDQQLLASEKETATVTKQRVQAGLGSSLEQNLGAANVNLAEANIREDQSALSQAKRALEVLLGRYPAAGISQSRGKLPGLPGGQVSTGVPASLLERRPDIRSAELLVDASYDKVQSARAARLPRLTLTGSAASLISPSTFISQVAAGITAPILDGGRLKAQEAIADARQKQALGKYASVSLKAFREVEGSLSNERYLGQRERELRAASARLKSASTAAEGRYTQGVITILELQQVRSQDYQTRSQLLGVQFEQLRQRLALYRALGGEVFGAGNSQWRAALEKEFNKR